MSTYVQQTWQGPATLPRWTEAAPGVPFSIEELQRALERMHPNKSVAQPFLPAIPWKGTSFQIANFLMKHLQIWWSNNPPTIPECWRNSWLFFLPKPGKTNTSPDHLRPISLMEPLGKTIMGLIASKLNRFFLPRLSKFPSFGFLPLRAATDAIHRVATHCRAVRLMVHHNRRGVQQQMAHHPRHVISGGISMFLDLTRAFDCVDRHILFQHMYDIGTPDDLLCICSTWHEQNHYNLVFKGQTYAIPIGKGVRQGCTVAPQLWLMYMDKFLQELCEATNPTWVRDHVTLYADDIHMGCQFIGRNALVQTLQFFGRALDILDRLKLMVSHTKSFMMLAVAGTNTRPALKGVVQRTSTDVQICIPRSDGTKTLLPVRSKGAYLGVVLSYSTFEEHTWHHRKKAGWIAFNRLRPWLKSRQIALTHRMYLWHTCIHTVLTYGLLAVQPTSGILFDYQAIVFRMLRIIIGDHAYLTHHTHRQALAAVGIPEPLTLLHGLTISLQDRLARRMLLLHSTDFLHTVDWSHLTDILGLIHAVQQASAPVPVDPDPWTPIRPQALHSCPHCSFRSQSLANMRRHLTQCHDSIQIRTSEVSFLSVALHGRPQCSNCMRMFASWRNFMVHIERDCCQVSRRMTGPSTKPASAIPHQWFPPGLTIDDFHAANQSFWPVLRRIAQHQTWSDIIQEPDIGEHLKHPESPKLVNLGAQKFT